MMLVYLKYYVNTVRTQDVKKALLAVLPNKYKEFIYDENAKF